MYIRHSKVLYSFCICHYLIPTYVNLNPHLIHGDVTAPFTLLFARYDRKLTMFLWYSFVPLFLNISISDAAYVSAYSNGPHLGRSVLQYSNSQNRSTSYSCVTFSKTDAGTLEFFTTDFFLTIDLYWTLQFYTKFPKIVPKWFYNIGGYP